MGKLWVRVKNIFDHSNKGSTKNYFVKSQKFKNFIKIWGGHIVQLTQCTL